MHTGLILAGPYAMLSGVLHGIDGRGRLATPALPTITPGDVLDAIVY